MSHSTTSTWSFHRCLFSRKHRCTDSIYLTKQVELHSWHLPKPAWGFHKTATSPPWKIRWYGKLIKIITHHSQQYAHVSANNLHASNAVCFTSSRNWWRKSCHGVDINAVNCIGKARCINNYSYSYSPRTFRFWRPQFVGPTHRTRNMSNSVLTTGHILWLRSGESDSF